MNIGKFYRIAAFLPFAVFLAQSATSAALAQNVGQDCIQQGFKPGTAGFYHCLQENSGSGSGSGGSENSGTGDAGSILSGDAQNAVTDFSGSSMDGATSPDPNILKQLNSGDPVKK